MTKDELEKAIDLTNHINNFKGIMTNHKNNPKRYDEKITLFTKYLKDDVIKLVEKKIKDLEKELAAL